MVHNKDKYNLKDIGSSTEKLRPVVLGLMVANELHRINVNLENIMTSS
jgi:hypothetical protein